MSLNHTAFIFIGYQNDYFAEDGILQEVAGESSKLTGILKNTTAMLKEQGDMPVISAPGLFYGRSQ